MWNLYCPALKGRSCSCQLHLRLPIHKLQRTLPSHLGGHWGLKGAIDFVITGSILSLGLLTSKCACLSSSVTSKMSVIHHPRDYGVIPASPPSAPPRGPRQNLGVTSELLHCFCAQGDHHLAFALSLFVFFSSGSQSKCTYIFEKFQLRWKQRIESPTYSMCIACCHLRDAVKQRPLLFQKQLRITCVASKRQTGSWSKRQVTWCPQSPAWKVVFEIG